MTMSNNKFSRDSDNRGLAFSSLIAYGEIFLCTNINGQQTLLLPICLLLPLLFP